MSKRNSSMPKERVQKVIQDPVLRTTESVDNQLNQEFWNSILSQCEKYQRDIVSIPQLAPVPGLPGLFYVSSQLTIVRRQPPQ